MQKENRSKKKTKGKSDLKQVRGEKRLETGKLVNRIQMKIKINLCKLQIYKFSSIAIYFHSIMS